MMLKPMFSYFGSRWRAARRYGPPRCDLVIEPFAGAAGYSTFWAPRRVILCDLNPVVSGIWRYLTNASAAEIMNLPVDIDHVDQAHVCQEAKDLIGYWFGRAMARPRKDRGPRTMQPKNWKHSAVWGPALRLRLARQVEHIRHWQIVEGDYRELPNQEAHWHCDPPFQSTGKAYPCHDIDYGALGEWCLSRKGFLQVCEGYGADWLPFAPPIIRINHRQNYSVETVFERGL